MRISWLAAAQPPNVALTHGTGPAGTLASVHPAELSLSATLMRVWKYVVFFFLSFPENEYAPVAPVVVDAAFTTFVVAPR